MAKSGWRVTGLFLAVSTAPTQPNKIGCFKCHSGTNDIVMKDIKGGILLFIDKVKYKIDLKYVVYV